VGAPSKDEKRRHSPTAPTTDRIVVGSSGRSFPWDHHQGVEEDYVRTEATPTYQLRQQLSLKKNPNPEDYPHRSLTQTIPVGGCTECGATKGGQGTQGRPHDHHLGGAL